MSALGRLRGSAGLAGGRLIRRLPGEIGVNEWRLHVARAVAGRGRLPDGVGPRAALDLLRDGFLPSSYELYGLARGERSDYLSDRARDMTAHMINGPSEVLLDDKLAFFHLLRALGAPTPEVHAVVARGSVTPLSERGPRSAAELVELLDADRRLVVKRAVGGGGVGLHLLERTEQGYAIDATPADRADAEALIAGLDYHVVTAFARQGEYAERIYARSTNTLRMLTMLTPEGEPFLAAAVHRFGRDATAPVDNWSRGGISAAIDPATGELGRAVARRDGGAPLEHPVHPDSGAAITGVRIPGWDELRGAVLALAARLPFLPYVGWDVVAREDGHAILEGNRFSDVNLLQVHRPLLADPRARDFYRRHGVV